MENNNNSELQQEIEDKKYILKEEFVKYFFTYRKKILGSLIGFLFGILFLILGFFKTFVILICTLIGYIIGSRWSVEEDLRKLIERLIPNRFK